MITQSPQTRVIEIGHTAVMQCRSTGNPTPKIYWLKDGKRLEMSIQRYTLIDGKFLDHLKQKNKNNTQQPIKWQTNPLN